ncbi:hypothetical protein ABT316_17250 [Streptomyces cellulosae]
MNKDEIPELWTRLKKTFSGLPGLSLTTSGSLTRGDFRISADGWVTSDLDLIPVIEHAADVHDTRRRLVPLMQEVTDHFHIPCTASITLAGNFLRARQATFVLSTGDRPFIWDDLGIRTRCDASQPLTAGATLSWRIQPVAYYLAKSGHAERELNVRKAVRWLRHLASDIASGNEEFRAYSTFRLPPGLRTDSDVRAMSQDASRALLCLVEELGIEPLPSTREFLRQRQEKLSGAEAFHVVRNLTFLENQGLTFAESFVMTRPATERG